MKHFDDWARDLADHVAKKEAKKAASAELTKRLEDQRQDPNNWEDHYIPCDDPRSANTIFHVGNSGSGSLTITGDASVAITGNTSISYLSGNGTFVNVPIAPPTSNASFIEDLRALQAVVDRYGNNKEVIEQRRKQRLIVEAIQQTKVTDDFLLALLAQGEIRQYCWHFEFNPQENFFRKEWLSTWSDEQLAQAAQYDLDQEEAKRATPVLTVPPDHVGLSPPGQMGPANVVFAMRSSGGAFPKAGDEQFYDDNGEAARAKWKSVLDNPDLPPIKDADKRSVTPVLLEQSCIQGDPNQSLLPVTEIDEMLDKLHNVRDVQQKARDVGFYYAPYIPLKL